MKKCLYIVLALMIVAPGKIKAVDNETKKDAMTLLASRGLMDTQAWGERHVGALVGEIKVFAKSEDEALRLKALATLANMGDTNAINDLAHDFSKTQPKRIIRFQRELERYCTQPAMIQQLVNALNLDEGTQLQFVDLEFFIEPRSVVAAKIIRSIILKSARFPNSTKEWAVNIDSSNAQMLRTEIRRWCKQNKDHLVSHEFGKAMPPKPITTSDTATGPE